ncbi:MAG: type II secretion system major pseudopilin GspG [Pseudomonadota bacterium]
MKRFRKRNIGTRGFTLVEIMAVVFIIGLLVGIVGVGVNSRIKKARIEAMKAQVASLEQAISMFHLECGFYPDALESLVKPPAGGRTCKGYPSDGFLRKSEVPSDAWGKPFVYSQPGTHNRDSYDLASAGPDGEEGTADDIGNWSAEQTEEQ